MPLREVDLHVAPFRQPDQGVGQLLFAIVHDPEPAAVLLEDNRPVINDSPLFDSRGMPIRIDVFDPDIGAGLLVGGQDLAEPPESVRLGNNIRFDRRCQTVKYLPSLFRKPEYLLSGQVPGHISSDGEEVDRKKNEEGGYHAETRRRTERRFTPAQ